MRTLIANGTVVTADGSYDASGTTLYFTRLAAQPSNTKRYKGGTAQNIWKYASGAREE